nr:hypothetical protein [Tanacetum cinerariifolium]
MTLSKEGFGEIKLSYLGGMWVMIELNNVETKNDFLHHTGVKSWFHKLQDGTLDFVSDERIGELMDIEESVGSSFARKRICIKTNAAASILETFKVIFKGKTFMVRAKELFTWTPCFLEYNELECASDDELPHYKSAHSNQDNELSMKDSDDEGVADTYFRDNSSNDQEATQLSEDPFGFYKILKKPPVNNRWLTGGTGRRFSWEILMKCVLKKNGSVRFLILLVLELSTNSLRPQSQDCAKKSLIDSPVTIHKELDMGINSDDTLLRRLELSRKLLDLKQSDTKDVAQKAKVQWAIEGDENSKFFHGIINKRRAQLEDLDRNITNEEIKATVWACGANKSPGPDGYTFEFFRRYWDIIGSDFCAAVDWFFVSGSFPRGCGTSFLMFFSLLVLVRDGARGFALASGLKINVHKIQVIGVGVHPDIVNQGALTFGCTVMHTPFKYLGVTVGDQMSHHSAWYNIIHKVRSRLSKWKVKTLSIGGRLTLLKSVLEAVSLYSMSIYKAPKDGSLWSQIISAFHGPSFEDHVSKRSSCWSSILREVQSLALKGLDFFRISRFVWGMVLILYSGVILGLRIYLFALVFHADLLSLLGTFSLSPSIDRWVCDLNGDGSFRAKDFHFVLNDLIIPSSNMATRWVKCVPVKVNVFAWHARLERLSTRDNLAKRGVHTDSNLFGFIFHRLSSGTLGSLLFGYRASLNPCWKEF